MDERLAAEVLLPADMVPAVHELTDRRQRRAESVLRNHWSCHLLVRGVLAVDARAWAREAQDGELAFRSAHLIPAGFEHWLRAEPELLDYDFFGVEVRTQSDPPAIVVASLSGDEAALQRVAAWIRQRAARDR